MLITRFTNSKTLKAGLLKFRNALRSVIKMHSLHSEVSCTTSIRHDFNLQGFFRIFRWIRFCREGWVYLNRWGCIGWVVWWVCGCTRVKPKESTVEGLEALQFRSLHGFRTTQNYFDFVLWNELQALCSFSSSSSKIKIIAISGNNIILFNNIFYNVMTSLRSILYRSSYIVQLLGW